MKTRTTALAALSLAITIAAYVRADEPAQCSTLLTQLELKEAVGQAFDEASKPVSYLEGNSECSFFSHADEGMKSVMFSFSNLKAIHDGLFPVESVPEFFDMNVRSAEEVGGKAGQVLEGIGVRARFFAGEETLTVYVETTKGFSEIVAKGLTRAQVEAVAKAAVAAP